LELAAFAQRNVAIGDAHVTLAHECGIVTKEFTTYVDCGVLMCTSCVVRYPIFDGLPVLLPYTTSLHEEFDRRYSRELSTLPGFRSPKREPVEGERFVQSSFSTEWLAYDFDGVIWEMDYADHERRFLLELGDYQPRHRGEAFLDAGCGIGITTELAQENFGVDAVGIDLSQAVLRTSERHRTNPFLHFVQASVFYLPFPHETFGTIYSSGVLHHTYSTAKAFSSLAGYCRPGGSMYVWVYGPRSANDTLLRRVLFAAEIVGRRLLQGRADTLLARIVLTPLALAYMGFNRGRRFRDRAIQSYNFRRAMHAARDRFTPQFAHRHDPTEVRRWFEAAGFVDVEHVDWRSMPSPERDNYRRNTGVRARKAIRDHGAVGRTVGAGALALVEGR
jgi:SAM-dependent methyltransferase